MAVLSCCLGLAPAVAPAAVQVDPGGPAGQQYRLPIDSVRGEAAGDPSTGVPGSSQSPPSFGQGIRPEGRDGAGRGPDSNAGRPDSSSAGGDKSGGGSRGYGPAVAELIEGSGGGPSVVLELFVLIGAMLLLGSAAGLVARRSS